jgi:hypothetical protein
LLSIKIAFKASLRWDPMGRLYEVTGVVGNAPEATTTRFHYDGDALVGEYATNGNLLRRYVHGADGEAYCGTDAPAYGS